MPDYATELRHLRKADLDIAKAKAAVFMQKSVVHRLQADGHDAAHARELLDIMVHGLDVLERLRTMVMENLSELEQEGGHLSVTSLPGAQAERSSEVWRPRLGVAQQLLDEYQRAAEAHKQAQRRALDARTRASPDGVPAADELVALGYREHQALAAFLDEMDRCARDCEWKG